MQNTAFSIQKGQNRKSQKLEFRLKFTFQWDNVYFICHAELTPIRNKKCMKFTVCQASGQMNNTTFIAGSVSDVCL